MDVALRSQKVRVGVVGVGNCASSFIQGLSYYRHADWLGSNRLTSSPSQAVLSSIAYGPFGET